MGFTHVELLPVMHHPYTGSWGYQVTGFFAPMAKWGEPDDLRDLVQRLHERGIGVLLDWVPAHFAQDEWALARFDGTALYEHDDPRRASIPTGDATSSTTGATRCATSCSASALLWLREYHADGLRVDARGVDAVPRLLAQGGRVGAERVRRAREPRRDLRSSSS